MSRKFLLALIWALASYFSPAHTQVFTIDSPPGLAGEYEVATATFGPRFSGFSGVAIGVVDLDGLSTACINIANAGAVVGNVALIDRGVCSPVSKAFYAQSVGAIGVIICNNDTNNPDDVSPITGSDDCQIDIPLVMLSYNDCQAIRMEMDVSVSYSAPALPPPGENFETAIAITDGTYTVDAITGVGAIFNGATGAAWYQYTAPADGLLSISSCGSPANTRLIVGTATAGCEDGVEPLSFSVDAGAGVCPGNPAAAALEVAVEAGQAYYIIWDDAQSAAGFDFTVSLQGPSPITLELNVNMEAEAVSGDGVYLLFGAPGVNGLSGLQAVEMSDFDSDSIYSGTIEVVTPGTIVYAFVNGAVALENIEAVPADCGEIPPIGVRLRTLAVTAVDDTSLEPVCFGRCTNCPQLEVAFTVDMANEAVGEEGVQMILGSPASLTINDYEVYAMTDNGDGSWSVSVPLESGQTVDYAFVNGAVNLNNIEPVPDDCGWLIALGINLRRLPIEGFRDFALDKVCFGSCLGDCPEIICSTPPAIVEHLDNYTTGAFVGLQSNIWTVWPGGEEGGPEDAPVSDEQSFSPPNSVKIEGQDGPDDVLFNLGVLSTGKWDLRFKIYVEPGFAAFYNLQNNLNASPPQWNLDVSFGADGTLGADVEGTYTQGEWIDVVHLIDLDNDRAELIIGGQSAYTWQYGPDWNLGAIDFFPGAGSAHLFYIDDVVLRPVVFGGEEGCPEGALICDGFESYQPGPLSIQSANWSPRPATPDNDGIVAAGPAFEGCQAMVLTDDGPNSQLLLLGDSTAGRYLLEWQLYIPEGNIGNYKLGKFQDDPDEESGMQVEFFADGTAALDAGGADVATFNWQADSWMAIQHLIDLDNNWITLQVDGEEVYSWPASWQAFQQEGSRQIGTAEFFGKAGVLMYIDNVLFQQLPSLPGNACFSAHDIQGLIGQGLDIPATSSLFNNTTYTTTGQDPASGYDCFGEPGTAAPPNPSLERTIWYTFLGDGNEYHITTVECNATDYIDGGDTQIALYAGDDCGNLSPVACGEDIDIENGIFEAEVSLPTEAGLAYYLMVDGFGPSFEADGEYCLQFTQLTAPPPTTTVTFQVDASLLVADGALSEEGLYLAGSFNDFTGQPMSEIGDNLWLAELTLNQGESYTYKFQNGPGGWEEIDTSIGEDCTTGETGDRLVEVGDTEVVLEPVCFGFCSSCDMVNDTEAASLSASLQVFPNPAREVLNIRIALPRPAENLSLRMVDAYGRLVRAYQLGAIWKGELEIGLGQVPPGVYLIQALDGRAQYVQAVIVE